MYELKYTDLILSIKYIQLIIFLYMLQNLKMQRLHILTVRRPFLNVPPPVQFQIQTQIQIQARI